MLNITTTRQFRKDYKRCRKRGLNMNLLKQVIRVLATEEPLEMKYHDLALTGNYAGFRECHIQPDWLLIYRIDHNVLILTVARTGSHSDVLNL